MPVDREAELAALNARRSRVAIWLSTITVAVVLLFLVLVAYDRPIMSVVLAPGLSMAILLGSLMLLLAWIVTGVYVYWANRNYDPAVRRLQALKE